MKVHIGKVLDAHGIRGDLYIGVFSEDVSWLDQLTSLFLVSQGQETVHSIISKKPHKKGFICRLENINDRNVSESLKGSDVLVLNELFVSKDGEQPYLSEILNFEVYQKDQLIGTVKGFSSNGAQDILLVSTEQSEFEIPFVKEFVIEMNFEKNRIVMKLPEGLLAIND